MFVNIPSWVKGIIWLVGGLVSLWAVIDAIRGYWGMYKEYGPSVQAATYHRWAASPVRSTFAIAVIGAIVAALGFYLFASQSPSAMPEKQPANPPISVTGFSIDSKPYEIGKII